MMIKICKECGLPFESRGRGSFCKRDHYRPCPICGIPVKIKNRAFGDPPRCCSAECARKLATKTNIERYGVADAGNSEESKNKRKRTCQERYGVDNPAVLQSSKDKCIETCQKKYGVDSPSQVPEAREKMRQAWKDKSSEELNEISKKRESSCLKIYGVRNPRQSKVVAEKIRQTNMERYGAPCVLNLPEVNAIAVKNAQSKEAKEKRKATYEQKYGGYFNQSPIIREKIRNTMMERYGEYYAERIPEFQRKRINTCLERYGELPWLSDKSMMNQRKRYLEQGVACNRISKTNQKFQQELSNVGIYSELEWPINPYWYDIVIPDKQLVIEIDPTFTHSTQENEAYHTSTNKFYHRDKTIHANRNGYQCMHVFDWDKPDQIAEMLAPREHIYARKCKIVTIEASTCNKFLDRYHLQGSVRGQSIRLGLLYEGELVSVMTFGKPRYNRNYDVELLRYAEIYGYHVIGGAEKLFKTFIDEHVCDSIISYCDYSKFSGNVYEKLGFKHVRTNSPACVWSKSKQKITQSLLVARGYDQLFGTNYRKGTSNEELMINNGWRAVYDCGQGVYEWIRR